MSKSNGMNTIKFLLDRWKKLSTNAAVEKAILENIEFAKKNNFPTEQIPETIKITKPVDHVNMIKKRIVEIEPKLEWILEDFNPKIELNTESFIELYIAHQLIVINKVKTLIRSKDVESRNSI